MINFLKKLPDWIYKKKCYICGSSKENSKICSCCLKKINYLPYKEINCISKTKIYSCSFYEKTIQKMIRGIKYHNQKELSFYLAKILYKYWINLSLKNDSYVVIAVPLFEERLKKRKYNHMELIARDFCELTNFEYDFNSLKRIKNTKPQYDLTKKQREKNLKDAFCFTFDGLKNKNILLIDDISTTGATLKEIIKEIQKNCNNNITALVLSIPNNT